MNSLRNAALTAALVVLIVMCPAWFAGRSSGGGAGAPAAPGLSKRGESTSAPLESPVQPAERRAASRPAGQHQGEAQATEGSLAGDRGTIRGVVLDDSDAACPGIRVVLRTGDSRGSVAETDTNGEGRFAFEGLPHGRYTADLPAESLPEGMLGPWRAGTAPVGHGTDYDAPVVEVSAGGGIFDVVLRVHGAATVVGRVVGPGGRPVEGAHLRLQSAAVFGQPPSLCSDGTSNADGQFELREVYPGLYRLMVGPPRTEGPPQGTVVPIDVDVSGPGLHSLGTIRIGEGRNRIRGSLVDDEGVPYSGLQVICFPAEDPGPGRVGHTLAEVLASAVTDRQGRYLLEGLPDAVVSVYVTVDYEPGRPGAGKPAWWVEPYRLDLRGQVSDYEVPLLMVERSRPFTWIGVVDLDPGQARARRPNLGDVRVTVALADPAARRVPHRPWPWEHRGTLDVRFDEEAGGFLWTCETPHPAVRIRISAHRKEAILTELEVTPVPDGREETSIRIP